jgi:signal transduction histidine kinase
VFASREAPLEAASAETEVAFTAARSRRLVAARIAGATLTAITAGVWLGPWFAAGWLMVLLAFEHWSAPMLKSVSRGMDARDRDLYARPWFIVVGSMLYLTPCVSAWLVAGETFGAIGAFYLACMLVHGAMYRSSTPIFAIASLGPPSLAAVALPLVTGSTPTGMVLAGLGGLQLAGVVFLSLTERQGLIEKSVTLQTEAVDADRANKAKSQFLAVMSHELRTPLNAIIGYAELLEEGLEDGESASVEDVRRIAGAGRTLLTLINDILDLSRIEAGRIEMNMAPTDVREVIRSAVEVCRPLAEKNGNTVKVTIAPALAFIEADAFRLRQCVVNLLSNACKFTSNGDIVVSAEGAGEGVEICVADTGIGITDEQMSKLFQPFVQADASITRAYGGTGLGLSITKRLTELMGGTLTLSSKRGHGVLAVLAMRSSKAEALAAAA